MLPTTLPGVQPTPGAMLTNGKPWRVRDRERRDVGERNIVRTGGNGRDVTAGVDPFCVIWTSRPALAKYPLSAA